MFTLKKVILSASLALTVSSVAFAQAPQTQIQKESYSMGATPVSYTHLRAHET